MIAVWVVDGAHRRYGGDLGQDAELVAAYEEAGAHRLILPPDGADHRAAYERAASPLNR